MSSSGMATSPEATENATALFHDRIVGHPGSACDEHCFAAIAVIARAIDAAVVKERERCHALVSKAIDVKGNSSAAGKPEWESAADAFSFLFRAIQ